VIGFACWGLALGAVGLVPSRAGVPALLAVAGAGGILTEVAGRLLLQRSAPNEVLSRVFGVLEGLSMAAIGLGSVIVPASISRFGVQATLVGAGGLMLAGAVGVWRRLAAAEVAAPLHAAELALLREMPMFAPLPAEVAERVAAAMTGVQAPAGTVVIRQGADGDRFEVCRRPGRRAPRRPLGGHHGPWRLLRRDRPAPRRPRTATVVATTDTALYALERIPFLEAISGRPLSTERANAIATERHQAQGQDGA
jgi:hypothetical protein